MSMTRDALTALILELTPLQNLGPDAIAASEELLTGGLIDSLGLLQIVEALERALGKPVPPGLISVDNFNSLAAIEALQAKLAA